MRIGDGSLPLRREQLGPVPFQRCQMADQLASADKEALVAQIKFHKAMRQILTQDQLTALSKNQK